MLLVATNIQTNVHISEWYKAISILYEGILLFQLDISKNWTCAFSAYLDAFEKMVGEKKPTHPRILQLQLTMLHSYESESGTERLQLFNYMDFGRLTCHFLFQHSCLCGVCRWIRMWNYWDRLKATLHSGRQWSAKEADQIRHPLPRTPKWSLDSSNKLPSCWSRCFSASLAVICRDFYILF